jgi:hypothetical protein
MLRYVYFYVILDHLVKYNFQIELLDACRNSTVVSPVNASNILFIVLCLFAVDQLSF